MPSRKNNIRSSPQGQRSNEDNHQPTTDARVEKKKKKRAPPSKKQDGPAQKWNDARDVPIIVALRAAKCTNKAIGEYLRPTRTDQAVRIKCHHACEWPNSRNQILAGMTVHYLDWLRGDFWHNSAAARADRHYDENWAKAFPKLPRTLSQLIHISEATLTQVPPVNASVEIVQAHANGAASAILAPAPAVPAPAVSAEIVQTRESDAAVVLMSISSGIRPRIHVVPASAAPASATLTLAAPAPAVPVPIKPTIANPGGPTQRQQFPPPPSSNTASAANTRTPSPNHDYWKTVIGHSTPSPATSSSSGLDSHSPAATTKYYSSMPPVPLASPSPVEVYRHEHACSSQTFHAPRPAVVVQTDDTYVVTHHPRSWSMPPPVKQSQPWYQHQWRQKQPQQPGDEHHEQRHPASEDQSMFRPINASDSHNSSRSPRQHPHLSHQQQQGPEHEHHNVGYYSMLRPINAPVIHHDYRLPVPATPQHQHQQQQQQRPDQTHDNVGDSCMSHPFDAPVNRDSRRSPRPPPVQQQHHPYQLQQMADVRQEHDYYDAEENQGLFRPINGPVRGYNSSRWS